MKRKRQKKIYEILNLFLLVFKTTALTIGGGLIIISELKKILVKKRKIISEDDFNKILATSNVIPGVTAINFVFLVGRKFGGVFMRTFTRCCRNFTFHYCNNNGFSLPKISTK